MTEEIRTSVFLFSLSLRFAVFSVFTTQSTSSGSEFSISQMITSQSRIKALKSLVRSGYCNCSAYLHNLHDYWWNLALMRSILMNFSFLNSSKEDMSRAFINHFFVIPQLLNYISTEISVEVIYEDPETWFRLDSGVKHCADLRRLILSLSHN